MISKELKELIYKEIGLNIIKEKVSKKTLGKTSCKCEARFIDEEVEAMPCASCMSIEEKYEVDEEQIILNSSNRIVDDLNDLEGLSSVANGPCKSLDEILDICKKEISEKKEMSFSSLLFHFIDRMNIKGKPVKDSTIYNRAGISKQLFSKIRSEDDYLPKKKTVLALTMALELSIEDASDLLNKAGYTFTDQVTDKVVKLLLENKYYNVNDCDKLLYELEQKGIKVEYLKKYN